MTRPERRIGMWRGRTLPQARLLLAESAQRGLNPSWDGSSDSAEPERAEPAPNQKHPNESAAPLHRDGA